LGIAALFVEPWNHDPTEGLNQWLTDR